MVPLLETTMSIVHRSRGIGIDCLAGGPIGPFVDAFKQHLAERRYAVNTFASYLAGIAHFARRCTGSTKVRSPSSSTITYRTATALDPRATIAATSERHWATC